jgi:hypothetical protein
MYAMNKDAAHKLGELIMALSETVTFAKVTRERNMLNGNYLKLQCYIVHGQGNSVAELSQLITVEDLLHMSDPVAMADIIADKIRTDAGLTRKRS